MIIGLTGGLATGKSTVARFFQQMGARLIDADQIARRIVANKTDAWFEIVDFFGEEILTPDGEIDRSRLAKIIFNDSNLRERLNKITHPRIRLEIERKIEEIQNSQFKIQDPIIIDAPLLIEAGMCDLVDCIIVVNLNYKEQIKRVMNRDNLTEEEARQRISTQLPLAAKLELADYVIDNNGSIEETKAQVERIWKELVSKVCL